MSDISSRGYANPDKLVSTDWVAAHLNDDNLRIIESNEDPLLYPSGHIPGAGRGGLGERPQRSPAPRLSGAKPASKPWPAASASRPIPPSSSMATKATGGPTYALWVFELFNHDNARIMDGGRLKWEAEGRELTRERPSISPSSYTAPERDDSQIRAFRDDVLQHIQSQGQLVDVRSPGRVRRRSAAHSRLSARGRRAWRAYPRRIQRALVAGSQRGRHLQGPPPSLARSITTRSAWTQPSPPSPIAASASAAAIPGSS